VQFVKIAIRVLDPDHIVVTYLSKEFARILGPGQIVTSLEHLAQCRGGSSFRGVQVTTMWSGSNTRMAILTNCTASGVHLESDYLVGHFGRTFWSWSDVRVDIKIFFFYISRGEYVKHFVIDAYL
jgi:hypothetical protein